MPRKGERKARRLVGDPNDPRGLVAFMRRYLEWMLVQNYSEKTVENRETYLTLFIEWCHERGVTRPNEVTKPVLDRYRKWLYYYRKPNGQPLSFRSQYTRLIPIRAYFKWLARNNFILYNPASELELPRLEQRLPRAVLTATEAETILNLPDTTEAMGLRDRAILEVFYSTGIRRMEVVNCSIWDVDAERGTLMVRQGKGHKDRMVPIGERALAWIEKYRLDARILLAREPDDSTLFLTNLGERFTPSRMTQLVRNYVEQADLGKHGACHLFRHTAATVLLEAGMDIRYIQALLGHVKLETTALYAQVSIRELKRLHTALHPSARLQPQAAAEGASEEGETHTASELLETLYAESDDEDPSG